MFAAFYLFLDHRLAFLILSALLISAAAPLAIAWARLLPDEKPPFSFPPPSPVKQSANTDTSAHKSAGRDSFAVTLLIFVTLNFLWQIPGAPREFLLARAASLIPEPWLQGVLLFCRGFFLAIPGVAAAYSVFRRHDLRIPLIVAGVLVPLLSFAAPWLRAAFLAP